MANVILIAFLADQNIHYPLLFAFRKVPVSARPPLAVCSVFTAPMKELEVTRSQCETREVKFCHRRDASNAT